MSENLRFRASFETFLKFCENLFQSFHFLVVRKQAPLCKLSRLQEHEEELARVEEELKKKDAHLDETNRGVIYLSTIPPYRLWKYYLRVFKNKKK